MNLPKAIEIGAHLSTAGAPKITLDEVIAIRLLVEAGERIKECRVKGWSYGQLLLPGETEE